MRRLILSAIVLIIIAGSASAREYRQLPVDSYINHMKGGWAGQMIGVSYGAPTEFKACGKTYDKPIAWTKDSVENSLHQDDVYVDLSFLEALEQYGLDLSYAQAGKAFGDTKFRLWHANKEGRDNVRKGIMPPDSGSPKYNKHYNDIDFQIEADFCGLINPGMSGSCGSMCDKFGRIMNSGDGYYGGCFTAAMYTDAFFEKDMRKVVEFGLTRIPSWSIYAKTIRDVIRWHDENPSDWRVTWQKIQDNWASQPSGRCSNAPNGFNIDASVNGAYVVTGLLYGNGDLAKTIEVATRCGQDSDCNPATAGGILCTALGYSGVPEEFKQGIPAIADKKFDEVRYTFNDLTPTCLKFAREIIKRAGGRTEVVNGKEVFFIPVQ
jgi:hypothetical protein